MCSIRLRSIAKDHPVLRCKTSNGISIFCDTFDVIFSGVHRTLFPRDSCWCIQSLEAQVRGWEATRALCICMITSIIIIICWY